MSDDRSSRTDPSHVTIPPELKPYMGLQKFPQAQPPEDDAELQAGLAAIEAAFGAPAAPEKIEPERGVGNVQVYVGAVEIKTAGRKPGAGAEQKVALSMKDVPRALPEGNRSAQTEEMSTRAFRDVASKIAATSDGDREPTIEVEAAPVSRTLGGQTERLPVIGSAKAASPWTKDASASPEAAQLPSSLRPRDTPAPGDDVPPVIPLRRPGSVGAAVALAVVLVAAVIAVRTATTKRTSAATEQVPAPTVTPHVAPTVTTASQPPAPSPAAPPASAPASAAPPGVAPPPERVPAPVKPPHKTEERSGDLHVKPRSVPVAPPVAPTADPSATPRVAPPVPPPPKSAPPPPGPVPMFEKENGS